MIRDRDPIDYALVGVVTLLAYLQAPWRPELRRTLRGIADAIGSAIGGSPEAVLGLSIVATAILGVAFVAGLARHASR